MRRTGRGRPGYGEGLAAALNGLLSTAIIGKIAWFAWTHRDDIMDVVQFAWGI